jgi:ankyrin repeat protein
LAKNPTVSGELVLDDSTRAAVSRRGPFALRLSAQFCHLEVVRYLVEKGANVHADNDYALRWSAQNGHLDVVRCLVEKGANVRADNDYALRLSAQNGYTKFFS